MNPADKIPRERRLALESIFFVTNAFVWLFFSIVTLYSDLNRVMTNVFETQLVWGLYFGTLIVCLIVGATLTKKIGRKKLFVIWTLLGVLSPFTLLFLNFGQFTAVLIISILFAVSAGLGMPSCMEYFVRHTNTAGRGRQAGLVILFSVLGLVLLRIIGGGIEFAALILIIWRLFGLLGVFLSKSLEEPENKLMKVSYRYIFSQKSFILYLLPWIMFSLVNYLSTPTQVSVVGQSLFTKLQLVENLIGPITAIPAGFLLDYVGRKPAAVAGFVLLGVSYSFLGLYPYSIMSWYLFTIFNGVTWGILSVLFVVCIWGELNPNAPSGKYYAIGVVPFFISESLQLIFNNYISLNISPYTLFSFIAFFLFIAVLPLIYAPETLPEKITKDRDITSYVNKALKKVQDKQEKSEKSVKSDRNKAKPKSEPEENDGSYEEAKRLAEKYY